MLLMPQSLQKSGDLQHFLSMSGESGTGGILPEDAEIDENKPV
jgi:hypothetical protein